MWRSPANRAETKYTEWQLPFSGQRLSHRACYPIPNLTEHTLPTPCTSPELAVALALHLATAAVAELQGLFKGSHPLSPLHSFFHGSGALGLGQPGHKEDTHFLRE